MNIVILGAGTAGLVTALMIRTKYPLAKITIIKSGDIGIVGVGEGSTEHWTQFMDFVGIDVVDLIYKTKATVKIGILFKDWNINSEYVHNVSVYTLSGLGRPEIYNHLYLNNITTKFPLSPHFEQTYYKNYVLHTNDLRPSNQYHFDTFKLNDYLTSKCSEREIQFIDTEVFDVIQDDTGNVTHLKTNQGLFSGDLFVDCSGFKRVISSKLGTKWVSKADYLPMNRAIAFPTEHTNPKEIEPYTTATALSAGWSWRIPTQERYGNGYVFNSNYISADQALGEINNSHKCNVEKFARDIKFEAGRVDKFWVKNVICIGLSGSFAEPLEAQSIGFTIIQAKTLLNYLDSWLIDNNVSSKYNEIMNGSFDNIVDYLQLHYLGNRNDSDFWRDKPFKLTDFIKENLLQFKSGVFDPNLFNKPDLMFTIANFYQVLAGLDLIDKLTLAKSLDRFRFDYNKNNHEAAQQLATSKEFYVMKHYDYIKLINDNYLFKKALNEN